MAGYLNSAGNSIGSLLRFIQEQKSTSPIVPPRSEPGSPIRNVVQEPLKGSEGQGTSKVVSIRPEGTLTPSGQPIEQGTPQSSRVGPISIGGADVGQIGPNGEAPISVVAGNEPGTGFTTPSSTRTTGDVINKTGAASGQPPGLGTSIKLAVPETVRGQQIEGYTLARDIEKQDIRDAKRIADMNAGDRSSAETQTRELQEANEKAYAEFQAEQNRNEETDKAYPSLIAYAENPTSENRANYMNNQPSKGQVMGTSAVSTPGLKYATPPKSQPVYSQPKAVNVPKAVSSGGLTVQKPAPAPKAPSIGTTLGGGALQALKKLFGWR